VCQLDESSFTLFLCSANNAFTGGLPSEVGGISTLKELDVSGNLITGTIPTNLGNLPAVQKLLLSRNKFIDSIPSELGKLSSSLVDLYVGKPMIR
jgi:Leucine-rich repeat (LRR) protein